MKRFLRLVSLTLLIMSTSGNTFAEEKVNVARQGTIRGRIVDTSKQILPGASIYIEKLHTGVTSDVNGYYTFANLTPGTYTVKVSYVGYSPVEMKITIPAGKTLEKDVVLNEGLELQEVVVGGASRDNAAPSTHKRTTSESPMSFQPIRSEVPAFQYRDASNVSTVLMYNTTRGKPASDKSAVLPPTSVP